MIFHGFLRISVKQSTRVVKRIVESSSIPLFDLNDPEKIKSMDSQTWLLTETK